MKYTKFNSAAAISALLLPFLLVACAADTSLYPSLSRRKAETSAVVPAAISSESVSPALSNADQAARLAALVDQARAAHKVFDSRTEKAQKTAVSEGPVGSEGWGNARLAMADLESARSNVMIVLADLDAVYADARISGSDITSIEKARDAVLELVRIEDAVLARLNRVN